MSSLFRKKSLDQLMLESQTKRLSRSLNTFDLILLGHWLCGRDWNLCDYGGCCGK